MAEGADCKLRFSKQYFLDFGRKTSHLTLKMKIKCAKERSTAYKEGGLELISERHIKSSSNKDGLIRNVVLRDTN